jgi:hypothetical protein
LSPPNIVCLLRTVVNRREPIKDSVVSLTTLYMENFTNTFLDSYYRYKELIFY